MTWVIAIWRWIAGSRAGRAVGWALAGLVALWLVWRKGYSDAAADAEEERREKEIEAHDRINDAETGAGLSDAERRERLRQLEGDWRDSD